MRSVLQYFVRYPLTGDLLMIAILVAGYVALGNIKSNFFPERPTKTIAIQVVYPGASPEEIEEGIVVKIEDNLKGVAGLDQVKSVCSENAGSITVTVLDERKTDQILQDVKNAVDRISSFPAGMEPPIIYKQEQINFAISFAVSGDQDLAYLKGVARNIESDLRAMEGISQVELSGFPDEEIQVAVKEDRLLELNLTIAEIADAIRAANLEVTGGRIRTDREELLIRGRYRSYYAEDLRNIVVRAEPDGRILRLADVALIEDRWSDDDPSRTYFNDKPVSVITVNTLIEEDILGIVERVLAYIDDWNSKNTDVNLFVIRDGSITLLQRIELLVNNGVVGFLLVIVVLALFLNIRLAFWVALAIPVSFAGMLVVAQFTGVTINVVSLFAMILVIGILVDDGIVIAENIYQHYERGASRYQATINGTLEVLPAVFSAIITTVIAFSLFFFIEGTLGEIFMELALVVSITLIFSLVEGALILPVHVGHSKALSRNQKPTMVERGMKGLMAYLVYKVYGPMLAWSMRNTWLTFSMIVAVFLIMVPGMIGGGFVKTTFFPFIEGDNITVNLRMESGTRDYITQNALDRIEDAAREVSAELRADRADDLDVVIAVEKRLGPTAHEGRVNIQLLDGEARDMRILDITAMIRSRVGAVYGAENLSYATFSPFGRPVSVSLLGNNLRELNAAAEDLREELSKMEELKDIIDNNQKGLKEVEIYPKPKAYYLGLTEQEILRQLRDAFFGNEVQRLQRGIDEVRVWVRYDEADRASVEQLGQTRIRTPEGLEVPLTEVADYEVARGIVAINRLYGKREVQVSADLARADVSATDANSEIRERILPEILSKYPSVSVSYEGQNREQVKSQESIQKVLPFILLAMFFVVVLTFRSPLQAIAVFALIPFGLVGVSFGHWVMGAQISLFSILGIIALIGILINDALVFVAALNANLREGYEFRDALFNAGLSRFRPIILTSITTIVGLGPLMVQRSLQAQFLIPMAISVAFGLLFITVIILFLLPIFLLWVSPLHGVWVWVKTGNYPDATSREPAIRERINHKTFEDGEDE